MISRAKDIIEKEIDVLKNIPLEKSLEEAVKILASCKGKVIFCGMGKAGLVAKKISATLSSSGTPSVFLHPGESQHGDLGIMGEGDVLVTMSNSGKTREVIETVHLSKGIGSFPTISITSDLESELAKVSDIRLSIGSFEEVGPFGLMPTCSTTAMTVLGDILCVLTMEERGFTLEDYSKRHHGGYIGVQARDAKGRDEGG